MNDAAPALSGTTPLDSGFHLLATGATTQSGRIDALMTAITALCGLVALVIVLIVEKGRLFHPAPGRS